LKLLLLIIPLLLSFRTNTDLDSEKYLNFIAAVKNISTFSYFTVIKVKDLNSGIVKEVCTKGNFVSGALHIELNIGYDNKREKDVLRFPGSQ
jgi:hypothetical protein